MKNYTINGKNIKFKPHQFEGKLSLQNYEQQILSALSKIGVTSDYVDIVYEDRDDESFAQAHWIINHKNFVFRCDSQQDATSNLGAIAQAIQEDIRQVTRGIKDLFTIMNQYERKEVRMKKKNLFDFGDSISSEEAFDVEELKINKRINEPLDRKYAYLENYDKDKLDSLYFKLKQGCMVQNRADHPMFCALKIVRIKRGYEL